ncbi:hypothetical protein SH528x_003194 [Novipirellula sp. SH528]|uniref:hypothetical protein n=1 Tax=Novipirellula sp. SH528 TaxID=3454466 RepID=UPI003FA03399
MDRRTVSNSVRRTLALTERRQCGFHFKTSDASRRSNAWFVFNHRVLGPNPK